MKISYECSELIEEVQEDIAEFGSDTKVMVWFRRYPEYNTKFVVNYDFITEDDPITGDEVGENETLNILTLGELLEILQEQNEII